MSSDPRDGPPAPAAASGAKPKRPALLATAILLLAGTGYVAATLPDAYAKARETAEEKFDQRSEQLLTAIQLWEPNVPAESQASVSLQHATYAYIAAQTQRGINLAAADKRLTEGFEYLCEVEEMLLSRQCPDHESRTGERLWSSAYARTAVAGMGAAATAIAAALSHYVGPTIQAVLGKLRVGKPEGP